MIMRHIVQMTFFSGLLFVIIGCTQSHSVQQTHHSVIASSQAGIPVPSALQALQQRPLHLPTIAVGSSCPTTPTRKVSSSFGIAQGDGPAYAAGADVIAAHAVLHYADAQHFMNGGSENQGWGGQKVLWFANPSYHGLILLRGHQINGPHEVRFGLTLDPQLVFDTTQGSTPWPNQPSYTRLQASGCYAYQVDGTSFSYVIVFQAAPE
jgi:hypothetical protein